MTDEVLCLSRFARLSVSSQGLELSTPLDPRRLSISSRGALALVLRLARPFRPRDLLEQTSQSRRGLLERFVTTLRSAGMLTAVNQEGHADENTGALAHWEPHDLAFHSASRLNAGKVIGATYRLQDSVEPEPAVPENRYPGERIALAKPVSGIDAFSLGHAMERRRSSRTASPVSLEQLGDLLYHSCRVTHRAGDGFIRKPYPSGGGLHPLEIYAAVSNCRGLAPGLYWHSGAEHSLAPVRPMDDHVGALLDDARKAAGMSETPAVLLIMAARFRRTAYKYEGIAYRLIMLEAGALMQTMYLVAAALNMGCCALGCGNSQLFAEAAGTDQFRESSVAELIIGGPAAEPEA